MPRKPRQRRRPVPQLKQWLELTLQERDQLLRNAATTIGDFGMTIAADLDKAIRHIKFPNVHVTYEGTPSDALVSLALQARKSGANIAFSQVIYEGVAPRTR